MLLKLENGLRDVIHRAKSSLRYHIAPCDPHSKTDLSSYPQKQLASKTTFVDAGRAAPLVAVCNTRMALYGRQGERGLGAREGRGKRASQCKGRGQNQSARCKLESVVGTFLLHRSISSRLYVLSLLCVCVRACRTKSPAREGADKGTGAENLQQQQQQQQRQAPLQKLPPPLPSCKRSLQVTCACSREQMCICL